MDEYKVDETVKSMFQADTLIGFEYFETQRRSHNMDPERSLILAILEDAVSCFKDNVNATGNKKRREFRDAEAWIYSDNDTEACFSFDYVCDVLGVDPGYIRKRLKQWKETKRQERIAEEDNHPLVRWANSLNAENKYRRGRPQAATAISSKNSGKGQVAHYECLTTS